MKKKGLSEVISITLAVLFIMVLGVSIYTFSTNFVNTHKKDMEPLLNDYLSASIDDVSIQPTGALATLPATPTISIQEQKVLVTITRTDNQDAKLYGVRFIFTDKAGNNKIFDSLDAPFETGVSKTYEILNTQADIEDFSQLEKISVSFLLSENRPTQILAEKVLE